MIGRLGCSKLFVRFSAEHRIVIDFQVFFRGYMQFNPAFQRQGIQWQAVTP